MKKLILSVALVAVAITATAKTPTQNDTIRVDNAKIEKVVEHKTTNSKGEPTTKYYFLYQGQLVPTSRRVVEEYNLCKEYNAKCGLAVVKNRKTNRKRIILS